MTVRYITTTDVAAIMGTDVLAGLFTDNGTADTSARDRALELASTLARASAKNAGYDTGEQNDGTGSEMVKALALSAFVQLAYGRKQQTPPDATMSIIGALIEAARTGDLPIPDLSPSAQDAVGGVRFTDSTSTGSRYAPIFTGGRLRSVY
jgi:hypothetical protein